MVDDGDDPVRECDDAATFWDEDDDYFVYSYADYYEDPAEGIYLVED